MTIVAEARGVAKSFGQGKSRLQVLQDVVLDVQRGSMVAVVGSSGSGKSTLLHILGGLLRPQKGSIHVAGEDLYQLPERQRARIRNRRLGFVYQMHHLLPEFDAIENVILPAQIAGRRNAEAKQQGMDLLDAMGIADRAHHKPGELSGGEQQRVAMARALINDPALVLADEPSGNLDRESSEALHELLLEFCRERGQAFLIATHSRRLAKKVSKTYWLSNGTLKPWRSMEEGI